MNPSDQIPQDISYDHMLTHVASTMVATAEKLDRLGQSTLKAQRPVAPRRGLNRTEAAQYIGVGTTKFDQLVHEREMPQPKKIGGRSVWDIVALDSAFDEIGSPTSANAANAWD